MSWIDDLMFTPDQDPTLAKRIQAADLTAAGGPGAPESRADVLLREQTARNIAGQYALGATIRSRSAGAASQQVSQGVADANANATSQGVALQSQEQADAAKRADALHAYADQLASQRSAARNAMLGAIISGGATVAGGQFGGGGKDSVPGGSASTAAPAEGATGASSAALSGAGSGAGGYAASENAGLGLGSLSGAGVDSEAANLLKDDFVSDPDAKKNVRPGASKVTAMIRALGGGADGGAKTFEYKNPGYGPGARVGIMTPALKASALGREAVIPGHPERIDAGNALGLALAALPTFDARIRALEGGKRGR